MEELHLTKTQKQLLAVLEDGLPHTSKELHIYLQPSCLASVAVHVSRLRKILKPLGQTIIGEYKERRCFYRRVTLYGKANPLNTQKAS